MLIFKTKKIIYFSLLAFFVFSFISPFISFAQTTTKYYYTFGNLLGRPIGFPTEKECKEFRLKYIISQIETGSTTTVTQCKKWTGEETVNPLYPTGKDIFKDTDLVGVLETDDGNGEKIPKFWFMYKYKSSGTYEVLPFREGGFTSKQKCEDELTATKDRIGKDFVLVDGCVTTKPIKPEPGAIINKKTNTKTDYYPLAPLPGVGEDCTNDGTGKTICVKTTPENCKIDATGKEVCTPGPGFANYLNTMINLFIGLCAVLAMIMIIMGGIQYMTSELISSKEEGKKKITQAVLGLLLALGSYAILNTINPDLLNISLSGMKTVTIAIEDNIPQTPINGKYCKGKYTANQAWPPAGIASEQETIDNLKNKGITVTSTGGYKKCTYVGQQNCTSVAGLNTAKIINLKTKCGNACTVVITGGTECWLHGGKSQDTNHQIGNDVVDLNKKGLSSYLNTGTKKPTWNNTATEIIKDGFTLVEEISWYHFNKN